MGVNRGQSCLMRTTPNKRCREVEDRIVRHVREGASLSDAPCLEGIDEATFRRWRKCRNAEDNDELPLRDRRCWSCANCALQRRCDEAECLFKQSCIRTIHRAGERNWRARAWLLERRYRQEYGAMTVIEDVRESQPDPTEVLLAAICAPMSTLPKDEKKGLRLPNSSQ